MAIKLTDGTPYRSDEEVYFSWFLEELQAAGYIESYSYETEQFRLFNGLKLEYEEQLKSKTKVKDFQLLTKRVYTPDFTINWAEKAEGIFYNEIDCRLPKEERAYFIAQNKRSFVEIKPNFDSNSGTRIVKASIDWVWDKYGVLVQLVVVFPQVNKAGKCIPVTTLFNSCCIPQRFLYTDSGKQPRKIRYRTKTIEELINERRNSGKK